MIVWKEMGDYRWKTVEPVPDDGREICVHGEKIRVRLIMDPSAKNMTENLTYNGHSSLNTAVKLAKWSREFRKRRAKELASIDELKQWIEGLGYNVSQPDPDEAYMHLFSMRGFAILYATPRCDASIATYEIIKQYGDLDAEIYENETFYQD